MKPQKTFADIEYESRKRKTKREEFLEMMNKIIPWNEWVAIIKSYYPDGKRGRPARDIETMLRMYFLQIWFNLSDEMTEESIYDSYAMKKSMGVNFVEKQAPDATTLLKFRHMLEENHLCEKLFKDLSERLEANGCIMRGGSIVDATIIKAPSSTKNASGKRDPDMHQTKNGNEWHFGMKAHIGVDAGTGYVHTVTATAANAHDITEASKLIRYDDEVMYGDAGYLGIQKREEIESDPKKSQIDYRINRRPGAMRKAATLSNQFDRQLESRKSSVRSKVEHVFRIVKRQFGFNKVAYRGIEKNLNRLFCLFASANAYMLAKSGRLVSLQVPLSPNGAKKLNGKEKEP
jgi:IS5 family transposase